MSPRKTNVTTLVSIVILLMICPRHTLAQNSTQAVNGKKGRVFFYWGYNRSIFAKSNLHFSGPNYDFTLYDLEATDRPTEPSLTYINPFTFTAPQYNIRLGYFLTERLMVSIGMDHMKYVVKQNQWTRISGEINSEASPKYSGHYLNQPIQLTPDLLQFEHTNGFNYAALDFEYLLDIARFPKQKLKLQWNTGLGGIWVITKTDVKVMGDGLDNHFHLSGYAISGKSGPRLEYRNKYFLLAETKGFYASLPSVLIKNNAPERADHNVKGLEFYVAVGVLFGGHHNKVDKKQDKSGALNN